LGWSSMYVSTNVAEAAGEEDEPTHILKDFLDLLQRQALGLDNGEVDDGDFEYVPQAEHDVAPEAHFIERDRQAECVDTGGCLRNEGVQSKALGAHVEGKDLCGVERLHGCPAEREGHHKEIDELCW